MIHKEYLIIFHLCLLLWFTNGFLRNKIICLQQKYIVSFVVGNKKLYLYILFFFDKIKILNY